MLVFRNSSLYAVNGCKATVFNKSSQAFFSKNTKPGMKIHKLFLFNVILLSPAMDISRVSWHTRPNRPTTTAVQVLLVPHCLASMRALFVASNVMFSGGQEIKQMRKFIVDYIEQNIETVEWDYQPQKPVLKASRLVTWACAAGSFRCWQPALARIFGQRICYCVLQLQISNIFLLWLLHQLNMFFLLHFFNI